ncbi:MAG: hypothetical protein C5B54_12360 [Acidobacteria bacterium]|nr:MAG: hypothetical protein C5B54_12360 [Acidobacteriota bacterium]
MRIEKLPGDFSQALRPVEGETTPEAGSTTSLPQADQLEVGYTGLNFADQLQEQPITPDISFATEATPETSNLSFESLKFPPDVQSKIEGNTLTITGQDVARTSQSLLNACSKGVHIDKMVLHLYRTTDSGDQGYSTVALSDVTASSYEQTSGGDRPTESISFNFGKIEFK